jgi:hypothetical protein
VPLTKDDTPCVAAARAPARRGTVGLTAGLGLCAHSAEDGRPDDLDDLDLDSDEDKDAEETPRDRAAPEPTQCVRSPAPQQPARR